MPTTRPVTQSADLLPFLFATWPEVKRTKVRQWLKFGAVRVNDRAITQFDHPLHIGDTVSIQVDKPARELSALPAGLRIVFEDEDIIVIEKPTGLLSIASETEREATAYAHVTAYLKMKHSRVPERAWIVHRLDRDTSGLMVLAKNEESKVTLQTSWPEVTKRYLAIVEGAPREPSGTMRSHLDETNLMYVRSTIKGETTREAITHYKLIKQHKGRSLIELTLETGRRHQIRVQLAELGCPIVGDDKYGAQTNPAKRLGLHAFSLTLPHPSTDEVMSFEAPLPAVLASMFPNNSHDPA